MDTFVRPPAPLSNNGNMAQNWQNWKKDFMIFMKASNSITKPMELRAYFLRSYIGEFGQDIIEKIVLKNPKDRNDMDALLLKLDKHFDPPKNEVEERYNFFKSCRKQNESIEDYITNLKQKAATCNFGKMTDSLIRDKIIVEVKDKEMLKKLFEAENLNLSKLTSMLNTCGTIVQNKKQTTPKDNNNTNNTTRNNQAGNTQHRRNCRKCNQRHPMKSCPAYGVKCEKCGKYNHYTSCCPHNFSNNDKKADELSVNINKNVQQEAQWYQPTAPPLFDSDINTLYPNLNHMATSQSKVNPNAWMEEKHRKSNEHFQNSEAPHRSIPKTSNSTNPDTPTKNDCRLS